MKKSELRADISYKQLKLLPHAGMQHHCHTVNIGIKKTLDYTHRSRHPNDNRSRRSRRVGGLYNCSIELCARRKMARIKGRIRDHLSAKHPFACALLAGACCGRNAASTLYSVDCARDRPAKAVPDLRVKSIKPWSGIGPLLEINRHALNGHSFIANLVLLYRQEQYLRRNQL